MEKTYPHAKDTTYWIEFLLKKAPSSAGGELVAVPCIYIFR